MVIWTTQVAQVIGASDLRSKGCPLEQKKNLPVFLTVCMSQTYIDLCLKQDLFRTTMVCTIMISINQLFVIACTCKLTHFCIFPELNAMPVTRELLDSYEGKEIYQ